MASLDDSAPRPSGSGERGVPQRSGATIGLASGIVREGSVSSPMGVVAEATTGTVFWHSAHSRLISTVQLLHPIKFHPRDYGPAELRLAPGEDQCSGFYSWNLRLCEPLANL